MEQAEAPQPRVKFKENFLIALVLWKFRMHCPEFTLIVTEAEKKAFNDSLNFQEQTPVIKAEEVKAGLRIRMEDTKGNNIITTENNEADYDAGQRAKKFRDAVSSIPSALKEQLAQENANVFTSTDLQALLRKIHETAPVV